MCIIHIGDSFIEIAELTNQLNETLMIPGQVTTKTYLSETIIPTAVETSTSLRFKIRRLKVFLIFFLHVIATSAKLPTKSTLNRKIDSTKYFKASTLEPISAGLNFDFRSIKKNFESNTIFKLILNWFEVLLIITVASLIIVILLFFLCVVGTLFILHALKYKKLFAKQQRALEENNLYFDHENSSIFLIS